MYVNGKKLAVGVFRESSEKSPETLKTFLEVLTLTGGGKVVGKIGEKATTAGVKLGNEIKDGTKKVLTKTDIPHHKTHTDISGKIENPYIEAMNGGTHSGWAEQYLTKPTQEIEKGIKSFEKQIKLHQEKIKNPDKYIKPSTDLRKKSNLINEKWPADIARHKELKNILEGILNERSKK